MCNTLDLARLDITTIFAEYDTVTETWIISTNVGDFTQTGLGTKDAIMLVNRLCTQAPSASVKLRRRI